MVTGHFATALIPYAKNREYPLFLLLMAAQVQDILIPLDIFSQDLVQGKLSSIQMTLSHDIVPAVFMAAVAAFIVFQFYKDKGLTLWCAGLIVFHEICDLLSGFSHNIMGTGTLSLGFDFYRKDPMAAYAIELLLAVSCLAYYTARRTKEGEPLGVFRLILLTALLIGPIGFMIYRAFIGDPLV